MAYQHLKLTMEEEECIGERDSKEEKLVEGHPLQLCCDLSEVFNEIIRRMETIEAARNEKNRHLLAS